MYGKAQAIYSGVLDEIRGAGLWKDERVIVTPQGARVGVLRPAVDGGGRGEYLNLCANNYLGLSSHPKVIEAAHKAIDTHGFGMSSVRFICGTQDIHRELEGRIAAFVGKEDAILYGSAFDANGGLFETLLGEEDAVISDALNHASIIDGIRLCKAARYRYPNGDMAALTPQDSFSYGLAWMPDSQAIVYARNRQGPENSGIFRDAINGAFSERLHPKMLFPGVMLIPAADGRLLYTDSDADALGHLIYSLEPDGSSRLVVDTGRYVDDMALAPDGQRLAYTRAQPDGYYEIGLVDLTCLDTADSCSDATLLLTQNSIRDQGPVWSPDGAYLAYRQLESGLMSIRLLKLATGETVTVTTPASSYANVQWSPDGRWLSFSSNRGSIPALYALDLTCLEQVGGCLDKADLMLINSFVSASPVWQPG